MRVSLQYSTYKQQVTTEIYIFQQRGLSLQGTFFSGFALVGPTSLAVVKFSLGKLKFDVDFFFVAFFTQTHILLCGLFSYNFRTNVQFTPNVQLLSIFFFTERDKCVELQYIHTSSNYFVLRSTITIHSFIIHREQGS